MHQSIGTPKDPGEKRPPLESWGQQKQRARPWPEIGALTILGTGRGQRSRIKGTK